MDPHSWQNASGTTCMPTAPPAAAPAPPTATVTITATPAPTSYNPSTYKGPICHAGGCTGTATTAAASSGSLAPGNRVNSRIIKADDGSGILVSPDMTCFHVL